MTESPALNALDARLETSPHPLAFVVEEGESSDAAGRRFLCEVLGIGGFQKEGVVEDLDSGRTWRLAADEGRYLRGTDLAPAPLMHWGAGLHADLATAFARLARERGTALTRLEVTVHQEFGTQGSFARGEALALVGQLEVVFDVDGDDADALATIAEESLATSAAAGALRHPGLRTFTLFTNGVPSAPEALAAPAEPHPSVEAPTAAAQPAGPAREDLLTKREVEFDPTYTLTDTMGAAVFWHVRATGSHDLQTGLTSSAVDFPKSSATVWTLVSDAAGIVAPHPLAYFAAGIAFCYHTQLCRYVSVRRLEVEAPRLVQWADFDALPGGDIDTQMYIGGAIETAASASLLKVAENTCYAHRALATDVVATATLA